MTAVEVPPTRFSRWLDRRIPPASSVKLSQRNVFIFPTATGFAFGFFIVLLILGAINYQNSLIFAVAFLLGSLFLVTILHTFRNLSGLTVEIVGTRPAFVGEDVELQVRVKRPGGPGREGIQLGWPNSIKQWALLFEAEACTVRLFVRAQRRGWFDPARLLVETYYPLGLLRAWTWVDLTARALVYPKPNFDIPLDPSAVQGVQGSLAVPQGSDDFTDIREYQPGDPVKHILWRFYAKSDELAVKRYDSYADDRYWLDFGTVSGGVEQRLSVLTGQALSASRANDDFGLRLPHLTIGPASGTAHLEQVLRELALYDHDV
ncbi:MAG: DUF58 domain-containing protein [Gammaproteobacteria bacterium]|nr:DUF58 domain-containing protein [Gammaproteobacteria bacterium]